MEEVQEEESEVPLGTVEVGANTGVVRVEVV